MFVVDVIPLDIDLEFCCDGRSFDVSSTGRDPGTVVTFRHLWRQGKALLHGVRASLHGAGHFIIVFLTVYGTSIRYEIARRTWGGCIRLVAQIEPALHQFDYTKFDGGVGIGSFLHATSSHEFD